MGSPKVEQITRRSYQINPKAVRILVGLKNRAGTFSTPSTFRKRFMLTHHHLKRPLRSNWGLVGDTERISHLVLPAIRRLYPLRGRRGCCLSLDVKVARCLCRQFSVCLSSRNPGTVDLRIIGFWVTIPNVNPALLNSLNNAISAWPDFRMHVLFL